MEEDTQQFASSSNIDKPKSLDNSDSATSPHNAVNGIKALERKESSALMFQLLKNSKPVEMHTDLSPTTEIFSPVLEMIQSSVWEDYQHQQQLMKQMLNQNHKMMMAILVLLGRDNKDGGECNSTKPNDIDKDDNDKKTKHKLNVLVTSFIISSISYSKHIFNCNQFFITRDVG